MKLKGGNLILPFVVLLLMLAAPSVFSQPYSCKDMFFSDCHYPPAFTAIHAEDIKICDKTCEIYGSEEDSCSFYMYTKTTAIDENCEIYTFDFPLNEFVKGCNLIGMPVLDNYGGSLSAQGIEDGCFEDECGGYIQTECEKYGNTIDHFNDVDSLDLCIEKCTSENPTATFVTYTRQQRRCECYENGESDCVDEVVTYGTDIDVCHN